MRLTDLFYYSRKYGPIAILSLIFITLLFYTIYLLILIFKKPPPPPILIDPVFGKIEKPKIRSFQLPSKPKLVLDTVEGVPITASPSARVYKIIETRTKFSYLERIYLMAKNLGFDTTTAEYKREGNLAYFKDEEKELIIDITNYNFKFRYLTEWINQNQKKLILPGKDVALEYSKSILNSLGKYPPDLVQGKNSISLITLDDTLKEKLTDNLDEAIALRIDYYRKELEHPIVTPNFPQSQNFTIITVFENQTTLLKAQISYFDLNENQFGYYPLITGEQAWEKLKNYQAFFVRLPKPFPDTIYIKKMFLAYYDPDEYIPYFQPLYVFLGEDFVAYVPAVKEEYFKSSKTPQPSP